MPAPVPSSDANLAWHLMLSQTGAVRGADGVRHELAWRDAALLAWLAIEGPTPRARLAALLWPDSTVESARNSLRQRLFQMRKQLGSDMVIGTNTLTLAGDVAHDLADSDSVLGDAPVAIDGEYGHWLAQQRERRHARTRQSLVELCAMAEGAKDWDDALSHARELLALEPLSEDAHRRVMRLHYLAGDRAAALLAFDRCERVLKDEVGARPSAETLSLLRTIEQATSAAATALSGGRVPASVLRPPRLVGRDAQWRALQEACDVGRCAIVTGEGGMGKTRLVGDFAASRGGVLVSGARPGDARVVYASLSRLLRVMPRGVFEALEPARRRELARLLPELGDAPPLANAAERARFFDAVAAAIESPALDVQGIVFDDLHFADDASIELLHYVSAASSRRWIVGARGAEVSESGRALLDGFEARGDVVRVPLTPLDEPEIAALVASLELDGVDAAQLAPGLLRHTGGNPLYLLETMKAWLAHGGPIGDARAARLPAVRSVSTLIEQRIGRLSVQAVQLARCAAVAAPDFSIELASHVLGLRTLDLADPWAELEAAQVLRDGAFAHDLIYESALASVPRPVARRLHAEIAEYLSGHGGEPARVAAHWLEAGDEAQAFGALRAAAAAAGQAMRAHEQAGFLMRAADIAERLQRVSDAFDTVHDAVRAWNLADRSRIDDALLDRLQHLAATPPQRLLALLARGEAAVNRGRHDDAVSLGEAAAELARSLGESEREVEALRCAAAASAHKGDSQRAVRLLRPALPWVLQKGSEPQQQSFFNDLACCLDSADQPDEARGWHQRALDAALRLGKLNEAATSCGNLAFNLKNAGRMRQAFDQVQQARRFAGGYDEAKGATWQLDLMALTLLRDQARYDAALSAAEVATESIGQQPGALAILHGHIAVLWLHLGQAARAGQSLDTAERCGVPPNVRARIAQLKGRLQRALARPADAALSEALAQAPLTGRTLLQSMIVLDHAPGIEPAAALAACGQVEQRCTALGYAGAALAARIRGCAMALRSAESARAVELAGALLRATDDIEPDDLYRGELWLHAAAALQAANRHDEAVAAALQGQAWVQRVAREHVPPEFRDSFLYRNPVNRELLALAARLRASHRAN